jgi:Rho termination factor, N-terminal domain
MMPKTIAIERVELPNDGDAEQKAARKTGVVRGRGRPVVGRKGGHCDSYYDWSVSQLKKRAKELGLSGYSALTKQDLIYKLRDH